MEALIGLSLKRGKTMNKEDRKMLVMKAMQEPKTPGVFLITCTANGNLYIGTSMTTEKAYNRHVSELKFGNHNCQKMQEDWNRYGEASFQIETLAKVPEDRIPDFSILKKMENELYQKYIDNGFSVEKLLQ